MKKKPTPRIIKRSGLCTDEQVKQMTAEMAATIKANRATGISNTSDLGNGFFERMQPFTSKEK